MLYSCEGNFEKTVKFGRAKNGLKTAFLRGWGEMAKGKISYVETSLFLERLKPTKNKNAFGCLVLRAVVYRVCAVFFRFGSVVKMA